MNAGVAEVVVFGIIDPVEMVTYFQTKHFISLLNPHLILCLKINNMWAYFSSIL